MKARIIRDDMQSTSQTAGISLTVIDDRSGRQRRYWRAGAVVDHPRAYRLVQMGVAEPVDDECIRAARRNDEQLHAARMHYEATARGIAIEDLPRFFAGEMSGYNPDGTEIPGPNAPELESGTYTDGGIYIP